MTSLDQCLSLVKDTYILTYIDVASRWPEALPLRSATAKLVTQALLEVFCRNGFPRVIVSDNGSQFVCNHMKDFCKKYNIEQITTAPYRPQSNGLVERFHGTLVPMVNKYSEEKKDWAELIPLVLHFIRLTPAQSSGFSPFKVVHGWEPASPVELVYKGWMEKDLEGLDVCSWVMENSERVQEIRDMVVLSQTEVSDKRKKKYDKVAILRKFELGEKVMLRTPGLDAKLQDAWEGPYEVAKILGPLTYELDIGKRKKRVAHVNTLKKFQEREKVCRITTVLEEDTIEDEVSDTNQKVKLVGGNLEADRLRDIEEWSNDFKETLTEEPGLTNLVEFTLDTEDEEPIAQRPYLTPMSLKEGVDTEIDWLLDKRYIQKSKSPWSSPIVTVRKPNGKVRLCVDFKKINLITRPMTFFMPKIEQVIEAVGRAKVVSKMDLAKGYYQVKMAQEDVPKTAFVCQRGKFEFLRMPFGVRNAPAVFQTLMDSVLEGLGSFARAYMDDIVIFSDSWEEHVIHVRKVLAALKEAGLTANPAKCQWGGERMEFLGHVVGGGEYSVPERRAKAIRQYKKPMTKKGLRAFLGTVSYYRKFLDKLAEQTSILTPATAKAAPPKVVWLKDMEDAFTCICELLANSCCLTIPLPEDSYSLVTDASARGIGGVLQVWREGGWHAAAYHSRQTRGAEKRYSATELEALAVIDCIHHFSYYLYGRQFKVFTDHKALCSLLTSDRLNGRLKRMAVKLQPWLLTICYVPGTENSMADALSRQEWETGGEEDDLRGDDLPEDTCETVPSGSGGCLVLGGVGAQPPQLGQRDGDQPRWDGELPRQEEGEAETIE